MLGGWVWMLKSFVPLIMLFLFWCTLIPLIFLGSFLVCMVLLIGIRNETFGNLFVIWQQHLLDLGYALVTLTAL